MSAFEQEPAQEAFAGRLCPKCGLCCNGVLFADVRLMRDDDPLTLGDAGLKLERSRGKTTFQQPCACFDGALCTAYQVRPTRCRTFECHTLKQIQAAEITHPVALNRIREARRKAEQVNALLQLLGDQDQHLPLTRRYQRVMSQPIDLSADGSLAETRGELMMTVNNLMHLLQRDFLG